MEKTSKVKPGSSVERLLGNTSSKDPNIAESNIYSDRVSIKDCSPKEVKKTIRKLNNQTDPLFKLYSKQAKAEGFKVKFKCSRKYTYIKD